MKFHSFRGLFFLVLFFSISCDPNNNDINSTDSVARVESVSVPNSANVNETFNIEMRVIGSDGCSGFSRYETDSMIDTTYFRIYQHNLAGDLACPTVEVEIDTTINISFSTEGIKYLKFNDGIEAPSIVDSIDIIF